MRHRELLEKSGEIMVHELTRKNITEIVEKSEKLIIDVFASWCGPCMQMKPIFSQLAQESQGQYAYASLNVDEERDLAIQYGITSIPTFLFFKKGALVGRETGYFNKEDLQAKIKSYLS